MNCANMLGHAFDLAPVSGIIRRNASCTSLQSGSLVTIAQLLGKPFKGASCFEIGGELRKNNYMSFLFKEVAVQPY